MKSLIGDLGWLTQVFVSKRQGDSTSLGLWYSPVIHKTLLGAALGFATLLVFVSWLLLPCGLHPADVFLVHVNTIVSAHSVCTDSHERISLQVEEKLRWHVALSGGHWKLLLENLYLETVQGLWIQEACY